MLVICAPRRAIAAMRSETVGLFEKNGFDYVGRRAVGVIAFKRSKEEEPPGDDRDDG